MPKSTSTQSWTDKKSPDAIADVSGETTIEGGVDDEHDDDDDETRIKNATDLITMMRLRIIWRFGMMYRYEGLGSCQ